jgi:hypothetical protein
MILWQMRKGCQPGSLSKEFRCNKKSPGTRPGPWFPFPATLLRGATLLIALVFFVALILSALFLCGRLATLVSRLSTLAGLIFLLALLVGLLLAGLAALLAIFFHIVCHENSSVVRNMAHSFRKLLIKLVAVRGPKVGTNALAGRNVIERYRCRGLQARCPRVRDVRPR